LPILPSPSATFLAVAFDKKSRRAGFRKAKMVVDQSSSLAQFCTVIADQMAHFVDHVKAVKLARENRRP